MTHPFERTALVLLAGTALTACASPSYPIVAQGPVAPPPYVAAPQAAPAQAERLPDVPPPPPAVESRPLDALPEAREPAQAVAPPAVAAAQVDRPRARTVTSRSTTGRVVEVAGDPKAYTVKSGDTLEKIAGRLNTTVDQLAKDNDLKPPYRIRPGQVLKGPRDAAQAYVVVPGDTLFAIARRFGVSVDALQAANDLDRGAIISPGQKLRLPDGMSDRGPTVTTTRVPAEEPPPAKTAPLRAQAVGEPGGPTEGPEILEADSRTVTTRQVTGRVVEISVAGKAYKVKKGDSLERIAGQLDSDVAELARLNSLKPPYRIQPGQTIRGPGSSAKAYVVGKGDSLALIARRFSVTEAQLRAANGLRRGAGVAPGRRLQLPSGYRDRGPVVTTTREAARPEPARPEPAPRKPSSFDTPTPAGQVLPPPRSAPRPPTVGLPERPQPYERPPGGVPGAPVASTPPSDRQIADMGRGVFTWPIRGDVISGFGGKGAGPQNDGINIRAATGAPVRAAAAGDVVYAGDQVPGFGNLVLIKHADGWVTAYGHLGRVMVRMQEEVQQGQQIGEAGASGGVSEPQLHFEVRYAPNPQERARPVDPALVLPR